MRVFGKIMQPVSWNLSISSNLHHSYWRMDENMVLLRQLFFYLMISVSENDPMGRVSERSAQSDDPFAFYCYSDCSCYAT